MAKAEIKMPDAFLLQLSRLENQTDQIIPRVLEAGGTVALEKVRGNLSGVIGRGTKLPSRSTGQLQSSLGLSPAKMDANGNYNVKVGFSPSRSGAQSLGGRSNNTKIAKILEYGKHGQPPKPFMKPTKTASRKAALEAMKAKLKEEMQLP